MTRYNLTPISIPIQDENNTSPILEKMEKFFSSNIYDPKLQDWYYDCLINNVDDALYLIRSPVLIDPWTGLFSIQTPETEGTHSFSFASFIEENPGRFFRKKILTMCADYGILNISASLCGLNVVSSIQHSQFNVGTVITCIGNNCHPYKINDHEVTDFDVIFASCVFSDENLAWTNWNFLTEEKIKGKDVYFSSQTFVNIRNYINYDRIELVFDPHSFYDEKEYADITYGYMNKVYRLL